MDERERLEALRRLAELKAKAGDVGLSELPEPQQVAPQKSGLSSKVISGAGQGALMGSELGPLGALGGAALGAMGNAYAGDTISNLKGLASFAADAGESLTSRNALKAYLATAGAMAPAAIAGATRGAMAGAPMGPWGMLGMGLLGGVGGAYAGDVISDLKEGVPSPNTMEGALKRLAGLGEEEATSQAVGAALPPALKSIAYLSPTKWTGKAFTAAVAPFTETGARARAESALQKQVADPLAAAAKITPDSVLTPAQQTGEKGLLEIEKKIAASSAELGDEFARRSGAANAALQKQVEQPGAIADTRQYLQGRKDKLLGLLETRKNQALDKAEKSLLTIAPNMRQSDASVVVRDELEKALADAKVTENQLWDAVPSVGLTTAGTKAAYKKIASSLPKAQKDDLPEIAKSLLDPSSKTGFRNIESAKELQGLRSKLLEEARNARSGPTPNYNRARLAEDLADAVLDDLGAQAGSVRGPYGTALRDALDFTRGVKETFGQGPVGSVLQSQRTGADKVAPELTIQQIIGAGKVKGDVGLEAIMQAAGTPEAKEGVKQYMLGRLNDAAVKNGKLNTAAAEKFVRDNIDMLDKFPELRRDIISAVRSERSAQRMLGRESAIASSLNSAEKSVTAKILNSPVEKEIQSIYGAKDPAQAARSAKRLVRNNKDAEAGLRAAAMEDLFSRASSGVDDFGNNLISGNRLMKDLADPRKSAALREILGAEKFKQFEFVAKDLQKLEKAASAKEADAIIDGIPNLVWRATVGTLAARGGAMLGKGTSGASLRTAAMASREAEKVMKRLNADKAQALIIRAFVEPDGQLLKSLLTNNTITKRGKERAANDFNKWLSGASARFLIPEDQPEEQPME